MITFFSEIYGFLHNYKSVPFWFLTPLRIVFRYLANILIPISLKRHYTYHQTEKSDVVISFTSFPERIQDVWKVVRSLKNQSILPHKIILWLSNQQFPSKKFIPKRLLQEVDELFEIHLVDGDIRSHKKYFYSITQFPDRPIVTCDDDIYYHPNMLKSLLDCSKIYPNCIIANIAEQYGYECGKLLPYLRWKKDVKAYSDCNLVQIGAGGVLYPVDSLHKMVLRKDIFMQIIPLADDIWLNCMARLRGTKVVKSGMDVLPLPIISSAPTLTSVNCDENMNDKQISALRYFLKQNNLLDVYNINFCIK